MKIDGIEVAPVTDEEAEVLRHDPVSKPTRDQREGWIRQLEAEEDEKLPFTDEDD